MLQAQVVQVSPSIWCVRQPSYFSCSYGIRTDEGLVCVDAGMNSDGLDVLLLLKEMQASPQELKAILLTHWHNDHAAGAQAIRTSAGCGVYFHQAEAPWLSRQTAHQDWRQHLAKHIPEWGIGILLIGLIGNAVPNAVKASEYLREGQNLFGFEVIETPGHTPGHLSFYYPPEKALFAGDALAVIDDQLRYMARWVTPDKAQARQSMKKCLEKEIQLLCPGHRKPLTQGVVQACGQMKLKLDAELDWPFWG